MEKQYRIMWEIDEYAEDPIEAVQKAYERLTNDEGNRWQWGVKEYSNGEYCSVDYESGKPEIIKPW